VTLFEHTLSVTRGNSIAHSHLGAALLERGEVESAIVQWQEATRLRPGSLEVANNLAWLLATAPDPRHRDPAAAVRLAERAARGAGDAAPDVFDTLAAAYAAAGRFDKAIAAERRAIALARRADRKAAVAEFRRRLALYRTGRPYVEESSDARAGA
jgi:Flp pilus assembly protein TadD